MFKDEFIINIKHVKQPRSPSFVQATPLNT